VKILVVAPIGNKTKDFFVQLRNLDGALLMTDSCKQGIKLIGSDTAIDLVIVYHEPGDSCGAMLLRAVKAEAASVPIPIIMAGQEFRKETIKQYLDLDVDDIMILPVSNETLEAKVLGAYQAGTRTVLVVDDDSAIREILRQFLSFHRYRSLEAGTGDEALEILKQQKVDAVVTDISMPGMSGVDLLKEVKALNPETAVILITGNTRQFTPDRIVAMGADGYFSKPFHNTELAYTLRRVISVQGHKVRRAQSAEAR
jgi:DNA-binding response OmpR family regulator